MPEEDTDSGGLFAGARRILASGLDLIRSRLDLAAVEWEEERLRLVDILLRVALLLVLGLMVLIGLSVLGVLLLWDYSPVVAVASITAVYVLAATFVGLGLRARLKGGPAPFADTRAALAKDAHWLRSGGRRVEK